VAVARSVEKRTGSYPTSRCPPPPPPLPVPRGAGTLTAVRLCLLSVAGSARPRVLSILSCIGKKRKSETSSPAPQQSNRSLRGPLLPALRFP